MAGKIKGCTHHSSKVLKMAGGGSVPGLKTQKNPDGSQQYVRGKTTAEKLGTLSAVRQRLDERADKEWKKDVEGNRAKPGDAHARGLKKVERTWGAGHNIHKAYMEELRRSK